MSIIMSIPFRPIDNATVTLAQAESVAALVPANGAGQKVLPQGHTVETAKVRLPTENIRPWVTECVTRMGGIYTHSIYILPANAKVRKFLEVLEKALEGYAPLAIFETPDANVKHLVEGARVGALEDAVKAAKTPEDLAAKLGAIGATEGERAKAAQKWMEDFTRRMAEAMAPKAKAGEKAA